MIFKHHGSDNATAINDLTLRRSWAELEERVTRIANLLRNGMGLTADQHVAMIMENRCEFVEIVLGAILAGLWITPLNRHLAADELAYVLGDSGARVVFTDPAHTALVRTLSPTASIIEAGQQLEAALTASPAATLSMDSRPGGTMIYTSGTSGRPKGVKRARPATLGAYLEAARQGGRNFGLDGSGAHLITGPLYHAAPLLFAIYDLLNGAPMLIMPAWDEAQALDLISRHRIAHTHMVPTMFVRLLRLPEDARKAFDPSPLTLVLHGAAPVSTEVKLAMIDWWGPRLFEYWGATEGGIYTLVDSEQWLKRPGTVGRAIDTFEVFAVDDQGRRLEAGQAGTLYCRHKNSERPFVYHGDANKTESCYLEASVFTAGDLGHVDEDGYVYLSERRSNLILSGGVNIYPAEVEMVIARHPAVADVCVFGLKDEEWGEVVHAAIELEATAGPATAVENSDGLAEDITTFARRHLAAYKVPRTLHFQEKLPRSATGKVLVRDLRRRYSGRIV
ncbi:MAG: AMP-binding protein [Deltaproteobacteria bacterium]